MHVMGLFYLRCKRMLMLLSNLPNPSQLFGLKPFGALHVSGPDYTTQPIQPSPAIWAETIWCPPHLRLALCYNVPHICT